MTDQTCRCGQPTSGAWLCDDCQVTFAYAIANVSAYYVDLDTIAAKLARHGSQGATKGSIGKSQPMPVDDRFADITGEGTQARWDAWNTVVGWARTIMEDQPELAGPAHGECIHPSCTAIRRRRWPRNTMRSMCAYLDRQFRWIVREQWAPDMLDEFLDLERRLRRLVDRKRDRVYLGACTAHVDGEVCDGGVYAFEGDLQGTCSADDCEATYSVAASRQGLEEALDSQLCTAAEIARLSVYLGLRADRGTIRKRINQWHVRNRIHAHGHDDDGSPRFRYGEIRPMLYVEFADTTEAG